MVTLHARIWLGIVSMHLISSTAFSQSDNLRLQVANMVQDMALVSQEVKSLRLEVEDLRRENERLRNQLNQSKNDQQVSGQISNLSAAIDSVRRDFAAADAVQKRQIMTEINQQLESLARETEGAITSVARAVDSRPATSPTITTSFSNDYPKTGVTYKVRSGDTLSQIARKHKSNTKDIQNANQIANPARDLQVGQTIFIPIAE